MPSVSSDVAQASMLIRLPRTLRDRLDTLARARGLSRNATLVDLLDRQLPEARK